MSEAALSLVVSTVGRPREFARLLASLDSCPGVESIQLVLVDQSADASCVRVLAEQGTRAQSAHTTSGRGASRGRNAGLALATAPVVGFPDDNCWFPPATPARVLAHFAAHPGVAGVSGRQLTVDGAPSMLRWRTRPGTVTRHNFLHTSIMSTMFFARAAIDAVGHFDEGMGVGSEGWYGAGEESDLLLRVLGDGGHVDYDPDVVVLQEETREEDDPRFAAKMLRYGSGMGHLWRLHRLSRAQLGYYAARKGAAVVVRGARGQRNLARADVAYLRGLVAGFSDRPPRELREHR